MRNNCEKCEGYSAYAQTMSVEFLEMRKRAKALERALFVTMKKNNIPACKTCVHNKQDGCDIEDMCIPMSAGTYTSWKFDVEKFTRGRK